MAATFLEVVTTGVSVGSVGVATEPEEYRCVADATAPFTSTSEKSKVDSTPAPDFLETRTERVDPGRTTAPLARALPSEEQILKS
jgi:hypothetical protein